MKAGTGVADSQLSARAVRAGHILAVGLFIASFLSCLVVQRGAIPSHDGRIMIDVGRNLLHHGTLKGPYRHDGAFEVWSKYGPLLSILALPALMLEPGFTYGHTLLVTLVNPLIVAASAVVLLRLLVRLGARPGSAVAGAFALVVLSPMLHYSTEFFTEPAVALTTLTAVLMLIRIRQRDPRAPWVLGAAMGAALLLRTDSAVLLVGPVLVALLLFAPERRLRVAVQTSIPIGVCLFPLAFYNVFRYGNPLSFGYRGEGFSTAVGTGLSGLLVSPGKGIVWFFPLLLPCLAGFGPLLKRDRAVGLLVAALVLARLLFYARWSSWEGGICWGPRFLVPAVALLCVPFAFAMQHLGQTSRRHGLRLVTAGLVVAAAAVSVAGVVVAYEDVWGADPGEIRASPPGLTGRASDRAITRQIHDATWTFGRGVLPRTWHKVWDDETPLPLYWFTGRRQGVGVGLLIFAGAAWWVVWAVAGRLGPRPRQAPSARSRFTT